MIGLVHRSRPMLFCVVVIGPQGEGSRLLEPVHRAPTGVIICYTW